MASRHTGTISAIKRWRDLSLSTVATNLKETPKWSHQRTLKVLHGNNVPATLVEVGYLTNARTRKLLVLILPGQDREVRWQMLCLLISKTPTRSVDAHWSPGNVSSYKI